MRAVDLSTTSEPEGFHQAIEDAILVEAFLTFGKFNVFQDLTEIADQVKMLHNTKSWHVL